MKEHPTALRLSVEQPFRQLGEDGDTIADDVWLPAGTILVDVEVDEADPSVGIRSDSIVGTVGRDTFEWTGSRPDAFSPVDPADPVSYFAEPDATIVRAAPRIQTALTAQTENRWVVEIASAGKDLTIQASVKDGVDVYGYRITRDPDRAWYVEMLHGWGTTVEVYDDEWGDRPAPVEAVIRAALEGLPIHVVTLATREGDPGPSDEQVRDDEAQVAGDSEVIR